MQSLGVFLETSRGRFIHALMHADVPCLAVEEDPEAAKAWWERHEEKQSQRASMFAFGFESAMICALCHMLSWIKQLAWNRYTVSI